MRKYRIVAEGWTSDFDAMEIDDILAECNSHNDPAFKVVSIAIIEDGAADTAEVGEQPTTQQGSPLSRPNSGHC